MLRLWQKIRLFKTEAYLLYLALKHPATPHRVKIFVGLIALYLFSPIDIIPDFTPFAGYLDDVVVVPALIHIAFRLVPADVVAEMRKTAAAQPIARPLRRFFKLLFLSGCLAAAILAAIVWFRQNP